LRAAIAALPFEKPKLAVVANIGGEHDLGAALTRAIEQSNKVLDRREMKTIEATPIETPPINSETLPIIDHSKPFPTNNKSRFRRF
jgi:hypothetical protein